MAQKRGTKRSAAPAIDAATIEALVDALARRKQAKSGYPVTLGSVLDDLGKPRSLAAAVARSTGARKRITITATTKATREVAEETFVGLVEDEQAIVAETAVLQRLLRLSRTPSNEVHSLAVLARRLSKKDQAGFKKSWGEAVKVGRLPPGVGCLMVKGARKLFMLSDVVPSLRSERAIPTEPQPRPGARLLAAFDELDAESGHRNYVTLFDLRRKLPDLSRSEFDATLNQLRRDWKITLDPAEGRHERLPEEVLDAGIFEESLRLVYAARREA